MSSVTVVVPMTIRRRGGRKQIIGPDGAPVRAGQDSSAVETTSGDPVLVKALARAFRWRRMLEEGRYGSIREMAASEKMDVSQIARLLRLTLLAPDTVEALLDGREPHEMTLRLLTKVAADWSTHPRRSGDRLPWAGSGLRRPAVPMSALQDGQPNIGPAA